MPSPSISKTHLVSRALWLGAAVLLGLAIPSAAWAQNTNPHWIRAPDMDATGDFMPSFANSLGLDGTAIIRCEIEKPGSPENCQVISETPDGLGFGQAGIQVAMTGYLAPKLVDGRPVRAEIQTRVHFQAFPIELLAATTTPYTGPQPGPHAIQLGRSIVQRDLPKMLEQNHYDLQGLDPDRHDTVIRWYQELVPLDRTEVTETLGLQLARLFTEAELQAMIDNGTDPSDYDRRDWDAASTDLLSRREVKGIEALRARYCSVYACGDQK